MCKNNSEKTIISRNHKEISKDNNKNNSKKITFYNFFIGTWKFKQYVM